MADINSILASLPPAVRRQFMQEAERVAALTQFQDAAPGAGGQMVADLNPPSIREYIADGMTWHQREVHEPTPLVPDRNQGVALVTLDRPTRLTDGTADIVSTNNVSFTNPTIVYGGSAAVRSTQGGDVPAAGYANERDMFEIQIQYTNNTPWLAQAAMGSTVLGTAERPRIWGGNAFVVEQGQTLRVLITPFESNLQIDVVLWTLELQGPANFRVMTAQNEAQ